MITYLKNKKSQKVYCFNFETLPYIVVGVLITVLYL